MNDSDRTKRISLTGKGVNFVEIMVGNVTSVSFQGYRNELRS